MKKIRVTVWNEFIKEQTREDIKAIYPQGMHTVIAEALRQDPQLEVHTATQDMPDQGLPPDVLHQTDVLTWWGHSGHHLIEEALVDKIQQRVLSGMGLVVLHSAHLAKIFCRLMGTNCSLKWREKNEKEILWNVAPGHRLTQGLGEYIELEHHEAYGEYFDVPTPDEQIFLSWTAGGNVFRSGNVWRRGYGKVFYFGPGHETNPIYYHPQIQQVLRNAAHYLAPQTWGSTVQAALPAEPIIPLG